MSILAPRSSYFWLGRRRWLNWARSFAFIAAYTGWTWVFRLLVLTFITYFLMSASGRTPRFEEISEAFSANELTVMGLSAVLFVFTLRALNPITTTTTEEIFTPNRLKSNFLPGFVHGTVFAAGVILAFVLSGMYRYLGFFIQFDEAPLAALTVLARMIALAAFAYAEEFVFRHKTARLLRLQFWGKRGTTFSKELLVAVILALVYCSVKLLQFDLGAMQLVTLFLVSLALSSRTLLDGDFARGAGFWAALLIVFQPLLSLPALGGDFSGVLLVKHQTASGDDSSMVRFLTGGAGGPLSSFAFQLLLVLDISRGMIRYRKKVSTLPLDP